MRNIHPAAIPDYSNLVGVPYERMNCLELCKAFYKEVFGVELLHYFDVDINDRVAVQNLVYTAKGDFEQVEKPEFGDLVLIKIQGLESHVAVFIGNGLILHTLKTTKASVVDRLSRWKHTTSGFFRLREKND